MPISQNGQTLKQFVGKFRANYLSVFDHFVGLALKGLKKTRKYNDTKLHAFYKLVSLENSLFPINKNTPFRAEPKFFAPS